MAKKKVQESDIELLYNKLAATHPEAVVKGDAIPYTSLNGNMYSYLSKDGFVALRLPEDMRSEFLKKYKTTLVTAYGIVQKEYVTITADLLAHTDELKPYFAMSYVYAATLKTKPTKKKKS